MAGIKTPKFMQDINIFANGSWHLGTSEIFELPKIAWNIESMEKGGFEIDVKTGIFSKMETKLVIEEYSSNVIAAMADDENSYFVVKGSVYSEGKATPAVATIKGDFDLDLGSWKAKEKLSQSLEIKVKYFELEMNGEQQILIDTKNMIAKINGKDMLAELRANIA